MHCINVWLLFRFSTSSIKILQLVLPHNVFVPFIQFRLRFDCLETIKLVDFFLIISNIQIAFGIAK